MKQIQIIGNIGEDAYLVEHQNQKFLSFSVAVNEKYRKQNGENVEKTDWFKCTTNKESLLPYLKKGTKVFVHGTPKLEVYDSAGVQKANMKINALTIELLGAKKN